MPGLEALTNPPTTAAPPPPAAPATSGWKMGDVTKSTGKCFGVGVGVCECVLCVSAYVSGCVRVHVCGCICPCEKECMCVFMCVCVMSEGMCAKMYDKAFQRSIFTFHKTSRHSDVSQG